MDGNTDSDPFVATPSNKQLHRFSAFDSQLFALNSQDSPSRTKGALEAYLAETERRLREASELGTVLVKQRKELTERLRDVEKRQEEGEIGPELRSKLQEIEKEFDEVGRQTARAFVARSRVPSGENGAPPESPAVFSSEAQQSPSKVSVPSRKDRNQPSREHDLKFATEISTSLLAQVRQLQAVLAEKDDALKAVTADKSQLELETQGLQQRLRALDESEQRYKDENWNLETQLHELTAANKDSLDREQRLNQNLNAAKSERADVERELEELRQTHAKLSDDLAVSKKQHDAEVSGLRKTISAADNERVTLKRKADELTAQNKELAQGLASRIRAEEQVDENKAEDDDAFGPNLTPEHSPPPSPSKATPRHGQLESETLKSSLHHAHRMIQNLKNNIHREKTEKLELKRMLQEARDEVESRRKDGGIASAGKPRKTKAQDTFKKPMRPDRLGGARDGKDEILLDEDWEDHNEIDTPSRPTTMRPFSNANLISQAGETTHESSDAFETANERDGTATETDAFHTGAETLDGESSDDLTETEQGASHDDGVRRGRQPALAARMPGNRESYFSTASTSGDEGGALDPRTPVQPKQRYRLKINRGGQRRTSKPLDENLESNVPSAGASPASFVSNTSASDPRPSLLAELGNFSGGESAESSVAGTPSNASVATPGTPGYFTHSTNVARSPLQHFVVPKPQMSDAQTMTEPWHPQSVFSKAPQMIGAALAGTLGLGIKKGTSKEEGHVENQSSSTLASDHNGPEPVQAKQASDYTEGSSQTSGDALSKPQLDLSAVLFQQTEPVPPKSQSANAPVQKLQFSSIEQQGTEPITPVPPTVGQPKSSADDDVTRPATAHRSAPLGTALLDNSESVPSSVVPLSFSPVVSERTEPIEPTVPSKAIGTLRTATPDGSLGNSVASIPGADGSKVGLGFFTSVFGRNKSAAPETQIAEDETSQKPQIYDEDSQNVSQTSQVKDVRPDSARTGRTPFAPIDANAVQADRKLGREISPVKKSAALVMADEGTQTLVSAEEIERLLQSRKQKPIVGAVAGSQQIPPASPTRTSSGRLSPKKTEAHPGGPDPLFKTPRRPGSAGSLRKEAKAPPPLPPDHKQVIAAAAQKTPAPASGTMGPPLMPASAYRSNSVNRPRTPSVGAKPKHVSMGGTTPRQRAGTNQSEGSTHTTRRSSVTSFETELDERFNIQRNVAFPDELDTEGTDPRMIQAITQTMIGEFLWKYTRKAGRGDMSENRHRRFFWVHPYTRTLYWSKQDPSTAGRAQLKAKSVAIEAVRVVTDDNPMPPGLHGKSLVVITPGRSIKFTAPTGQRHETWFNALSYLLLRTGAERDDEAHLTADDVDEFNPRTHRSTSRFSGRSRLSLSSIGSRNTRNSSPRRSSRNSRTMRDSSAKRDSNPLTLGKQRNDAADAPEPSTPAQNNHGSVSSRLSGISSVFRTNGSLMGSLTSRRSRYSVNAGGEIYKSPPRDTVPESAEDLRRVIEQKEKEALRLDNVRACCDGKSFLIVICLRIPSAVLPIKRVCKLTSLVTGKHDVTTLNNRNKHASWNSRRSVPAHHSRSHSHAPAEGQVQGHSHGPNSHYHHQTELEASHGSAG